MLALKDRNDCNFAGAWLMLRLNDQIDDTVKIAVPVINPSFTMLTL